MKNSRLKETVALIIMYLLAAFIYYKFKSVVRIPRLFGMEVYDLLFFLITVGLCVIIVLQIVRYVCYRRVQKNQQQRNKKLGEE